LLLLLLLLLLLCCGYCSIADAITGAEAAAVAFCIKGNEIQVSQKLHANAKLSHNILLLYKQYYI